MVLNFKLNVLLNFISVYFVFYISFDLFLSETKIYSTKIREFFVGSSRPPYLSTTTGATTTAYRKHIFCSGHAQKLNPPSSRLRRHFHCFDVVSTTLEFIAKFLVLFFDLSFFFLRHIKKYLVFTVKVF